jgi:hypothetical protein
MIVVCPSCQRRYRHEFGPGAPAAFARCSACHERFRLERPKRSYVLVAAGTPAAALPPVAGDDPLMATPPVGIDLPPAPSPAAEPAAAELSTSPETAAEPVAEPALPLDAEPPELAPEAVPQAAREATEEAIEDETSTEAPQGPRLLEGLVVLLPSGLGAAMAYHLAGPRGQDPITWAACGGAIGLLLGWVCLLWITRGE